MQRYVHFPIEYKRNFFSSNKNHIQRHLSFFFFFLFFASIYRKRQCDVQLHLSCSNETSVSRFVLSPRTLLVSRFFVRTSLFFSISVRLSERNISRKAREVRERVGAAGFLLFCPAPFSKSALKEKRTGTVFRYTVTIDQRDRTTALAVRASRGEARRSEARRGEAKRDDDESGRTVGTGRDGTDLGGYGTWGVRGTRPNQTRRGRGQDGDRYIDETKRLLARIGGSGTRRRVFRKH